MIKIIALIIVVLIVTVLGYAATRPGIFRIQRATRIKAPAEKIFALIDDFHSWGAWSPYEKKDPAMKKSYTGPATGKGAVYEWEGNGNVGTGRIEITEASSPSRVAMTLDFVKPFEAHNIVEFTLEPQGDTTNVTWAMHGPNSFMAKLMQVFFNMDRMVGKDFEAGLADMKTAAEK